MAIKDVDYKDTKFRISYILHNLQQNKNIVFLHGWGSNKELMFNCFKYFFNDYRHIYIDLPGFGKSDCNIALSTQDYTTIINIFLAKLNLSKEIVVGHSFGGKIALLLNPNHLILLSSAGILGQKTLQVRLKIRLAKLLNILGLGNLNSYLKPSDVKDMNEIIYQTFKIVVAEDFSNCFKQYDKLCSIFWGQDDKITPLQDAFKIETLIHHAHLEILPGDHYFFLKTTQTIEQKVYEHRTSENLKSTDNG